jgi:hypothetical protein
MMWVSGGVPEQNVGRESRYIGMFCIMTGLAMLE